MAKPLIVARDLSIIYNQGKSNEFKALSGVNTDIFEGEYIILFGPSGCGKSTLMYSIQGSLPPGEGTLLVKGDDVYSYPPAERVYFQRHVMGIIFQSFNLIMSLSVLDNVALPMIFCDADKTTRDRRSVWRWTRVPQNPSHAFWWSTAACIGVAINGERPQNSLGRRTNR